MTGVGSLLGYKDEVEVVQPNFTPVPSAHGHAQFTTCSFLPLYDRMAYYVDAALCLALATVVELLCGGVYQGCKGWALGVQAAHSPVSIVHTPSILGPSASILP